MAHYCPTVPTGGRDALGYMLHSPTVIYCSIPQDRHICSLIPDRLTASRFLFLAVNTSTTSLSLVQLSLLYWQLSITPQKFSLSYNGCHEHLTWHTLIAANNACQFSKRPHQSSFVLGLTALYRSAIHPTNCATTRQRPFTVVHYVLRYVPNG
jgi:hypothetical protein